MPQAERLAESPVLLGMVFSDTCPRSLTQLRSLDEAPERGASASGGFVRLHRSKAGKCQA